MLVLRDKRALRVPLVKGFKRCIAPGRDRAAIIRQSDAERSAMVGAVF